MNLTLLLDLDDTLLINSMETFLPGYLKALSREMAPYAEPEVLVPRLLAATKEMSNNNRPDCTLKEVFDSVFYPSLSIRLEDVQGLLERFYAQVFPSLRKLSQARPEAVELVEQALGRGYRIAIATNPLFPRAAVEHRLEWAGLPHDQYPFSLISSYETFHFAKPNPAYFAEMLARLGWPEGPVVMVGDDLENDVAATRRLGLPVFWIRQDGAVLPGGSDAPAASGRLEEVLPWIESQSAEALTPDYSSSSAMMAVLRATPAALDILVQDLAPEDWVRRPEAGEWSPTEVICHWRDVEREVNLPRLEQVLREKNPFLPGKDTDPWAEERRYIEQDGRAALHSFIAARIKLLSLLEGIQPEDWQRPARHAIFGPTDLAELVGFIAGHDRLHIQQLTRDL